MVGDVQQVGVLQLLAEPLQQRHRLVQRHGHGDPGQVLADVVVQDAHDADVAVVCALGGEGGAAACITQTAVQTGEQEIQNQTALSGGAPDGAGSCCFFHTVISFFRLLYV